MKKRILILFFNLFYILSNAQIDVELIKKNVTENPKANFYPLLEVFKNNPTELTQDQLNQLYYGSKFVKNEYSILDYNSDYEKIWKKVGKKISKGVAEKILIEAEPRYQKNPLNEHILKGMIDLYKTVGDEKKIEIVKTQQDLLEKTVKKSGDGKTEQTPICVIYPGDVIS